MTTVSVFVSAMLDHISAMAPVLSVLPVSPMLKETLMEHAHARLATPTLPEFAPSAPKAPSGAHQATSAFGSADKTQHTLPLPMPVSATPATLFCQDLARAVLRDISFRTDTV
jgi:hypothetical protein